MQSDLLNEAGHPSTTVLPLTTQLIEDAAPLRYRIAARDALESNSDIMLDTASKDLQALEDSAPSQQRPPPGHPVQD